MTIRSSWLGVRLLSPPQRLPLGIPRKITTTQRGLCGRERSGSICDTPRLVPRRLSLEMKMCAQRKAGRRHMYPSHGPLRFITGQSRFALASTMRRTKRLRRRLWHDLELTYFPNLAIFRTVITTRSSWNSRHKPYSISILSVIWHFIYRVLTFISSSSTDIITNPQSDQFPAGLITKWEEQCKGIGHGFSMSIRSFLGTMRRKKRLGEKAKGEKLLSLPPPPSAEISSLLTPKKGLKLRLS